MNTKDIVEELQKEYREKWTNNVEEVYTKAHAEAVAEVLQECLDSANVAQDIHELTGWIKEELQAIKKD